MAVVIEEVEDEEVDKGEERDEEEFSGKGDDLTSSLI
jgi:hypothetical protein